MLLHVRHAAVRANGAPDSAGKGLPAPSGSCHISSHHEAARHTFDRMSTSLLIFFSIPGSASASALLCNPLTPACAALLCGLLTLLRPVHGRSGLRHAQQMPIRSLGVIQRTPPSASAKRRPSSPPASQTKGTICVARRFFRLNAGKRFGCGRGCDNDDNDDNDDDDSSMANAGSGFSSALCQDPESNTCPRNALLPACARKCQIPFARTASRVREYMMKGDERRLVHGPSCAVRG